VTTESTTPSVYDVNEADFESRVLERSRELPVVVDFWADWCGPCKQLTPVLERAVAARAGKVELAKIDTDKNQRIAAAFGVQGIPNVKAFRDGRVAAEFTGAAPPQQVERFFDGLVPSEAEELAAQGAAEGDEQALRRALELDPGNVEAKRELGRLLLRNGDTDEALELLDSARGDFLADGLAARARLEAEGDDHLSAAFEAWDAGDHAAALEGLLAALEASDDADRRDRLRQAMVGVFTELGPDAELARDYRRRLSAAL
jgi:putative thioredoxin